MRNEDLPRIDEIYRRFFFNDFQLPNLDHTIGSGVIASDKEIVGFGMVRLYPEAIIVIDKEATLLDKIKAIELLFHEAKLACSRFNYEELYAKVIDDKYMNMLIKRFGFKKLDGKLLVRLIGA